MGRSVPLVTTNRLAAEDCEAALAGAQTWWHGLALLGGPALVKKALSRPKDINTHWLQLLQDHVFKTNVILFGQPQGVP